MTSIRRWRILMVTTRPETGEKANVARKQLRSAVLSQMRGDCMICMGMSGSGAGTGMGITEAIPLIRSALTMARTAFIGAAVGTTAPRSAVRRFATTIRLAIASTSSASACLSPQFNDRTESTGQSVWILSATSSAALEIINMFHKIGDNNND